MRRCTIERNVNLFTHAIVCIGYRWVQGQKRGRCMYRPLIERTIKSDGKLSSRIRHGLWPTPKTGLPPPAPRLSDLISREEHRRLPRQATAWVAETRTSRGGARMSPKLAGLIGRTILVSIPVLFEDGKARPYRLAGIELQGLWLESSDLADRLLQTETRKSSSVLAAFVPFAQIASVLVATASQAGTGPVSVPTSQAPASLGSANLAKPATPASSGRQQPTKKK
jgi:hypothetical protein